MVNKLKVFPKNRVLVLTTAIISIPFLIMTILAILNEHSLITRTGYGILHFEITWTPEMMNRILTAWGPIEMEKQIFFHHMDNLYVPVYSLWGAGCILIMSRKMEGSLQELGLILTITPFLAGIFDVFENSHLLLMLQNGAHVYSGGPFLASLFAVFKLTFLAMGPCFIFIAISFKILKKENKSEIMLYIMLIIVPVAIFLLFSLWNLFLSILIGIIYLSLLLIIILKSKGKN